MRRFLCTTLAMIVAVATFAAFGVEPVRPGQESSLIRAIYTDDRLWLLSDAGELFIIRDGVNEPLKENLSEPVIDLCLRADAPVLITCPRDGCETWSVRRWIDGRWSVESMISKDGDELVALSCSAKSMTILTTTRIIEVGAKNLEAVALSNKLHRGLVSAVHSDSTELLVGINVGEWGGGLRRVNRHSGRVTVVERNASGELCGGPLNTDCDPVNGIAPIPWKPGCVAAAIGLVHMLPHGRIAKICGDDVQQLYVKAVEGFALKRSTRRDGEPFASMPFFGLASLGDTLVAVGLDGIYRFKPEGLVEWTPLPPFKSIGGFEVSFDLPDMVLVLTDVNQRASLSGSVPVLVPR